MTFRLVTTITAIIMIVFGLYLLSYGTYVLWEYHGLMIPERTDPDAHGMSLLVGYTLIRMFGAMVLSVGLVAWFCRHILDTKAQQALTLGFFAINALAFSLSLFQQIMYWRSGLGRLNVATFLLVTLISGYFIFVRQRP